MSKVTKHRDIFSWTNPKVSIRSTKDRGNSVFADNLIKKGEMICVFGGHIMTVKEEHELPDYRDEAFQIHENFVLGIKQKSELEVASFFNHSCEPNAGFKGQIFLVAMRDIQRGEEINFDYAMVLHAVKGIESYRMNCLCNHPKCRKIISVNDWKKKDLQKKYKGYFQLYLQEIMDKIKK